MAANLDHRSSDADSIRFMEGELSEDEMAKVMMDPKYWDFLASRLSKYSHKSLADEIVRQIMEEDTTDPARKGINGKVLEDTKSFPDEEQKRQECDEWLQALYADVLLGGKFDFLKDWIFSVDEGEDGGEAEGEEEAEKENGESEARGPQGWEWTESDAEAEVWLFEQLVAARSVMVELNGNIRGEVRKVWEWTESDSEAEKEVGRELTKHASEARTRSSKT